LNCSVSKNTEAVWVNKEKMANKVYKKTFIVVMTSNVDARQKVEQALADAAKSRGYMVVKSIDVISPALSEKKGPSKERVRNAVIESGCDGVFEVTLLRKEEEVRYSPGVVSYRPTFYWHWNRNMWHYYTYWYPTVTTPGYYDKEREYFIQSNFYDVVTEELMISVQSDIYNPSTIKSFANLYVKDIIRQMENAGLLGK
jgi:hypothetical protein